MQCFQCKQYFSCCSFYDQQIFNRIFTVHSPTNTTRLWIGFWPYLKHTPLFCCFSRLFLDKGQSVLKFVCLFQENSTFPLKMFVLSKEYHDIKAYWSIKKLCFKAVLKLYEPHVFILPKYNWKRECPRLSSFSYCLLKKNENN